MMFLACVNNEKCRKNCVRICEMDLHTKTENINNITYHIICTERRAPQKKHAVRLFICSLLGIHFVPCSFARPKLFIY